MQTLTENFIVELFATCLSNRNALEIVNLHLADNYLPEESYKKTWQAIKQTFELTRKLPTIGTLNESLKDNQEALRFLVKIKKCKVQPVDVVFPFFEKFIKEVRFIELYTDSGKLWNQGKQEEAIQLLAKDSEKIHTFSLSEGLYAKVFLDFEKRQEIRRTKERDQIIKVPFGITALDYYSRGGVNIGTSALFLGRSGTGKSTLLRWMAINAARLGLISVHFQIESSEEETMNAYDAAWLGENLESIEFNGISKEKVQKLKNVHKDILDKKGEVFVMCPEQFGSLSIEDCVQTIEEIEKNYGKVSLVLFDNLELFTTKGRFSTTEMGERQRRESLANKITNLSITHKLAVAATTQSNDVSPQQFNDPSFVLTRHNINEFKNLVKPFSFFATVNQTWDEYEASICRIYIDKMRKYKSGQTIKVYQALDNSRFYDSGATLKTFWDAEKNCPKT